MSQVAVENWAVGYPSPSYDHEIIKNLSRRLSQQKGHTALLGAAGGNGRWQRRIAELRPFGGWWTTEWAVVIASRAGPLAKLLVYAQMRRLVKLSCNALCQFNSVFPNWKPDWYPLGSISRLKTMHSSNAHCVVDFLSTLLCRFPLKTCMLTIVHRSSVLLQAADIAYGAPVFKRLNGIIRLRREHVDRSKRLPAARNLLK